MAVVRVAVAVLLGIHGYYRALSGGAAPFGGWLASLGFPAGHALAWAITLFEIGASVLLLVGRFVPWVASGFVAILAGGIVLVHGAEGWFVVGAGRNGVEFSVLLIACLLALILDARRAGQPPSST